MKEMIEENRFDIPSPLTYKSCDFDPLPYFFAGDEIFPLKTWLMRHYPGKLDKEQMIFTIACHEQEGQLEMLLAFLAHVGEYSTLE